MELTFSHLDEDGSARMVDVGGKEETERVAIVQGSVELNASTMALLKAKALPKGDVLAVAKIAGIMAAKRTSELIPMCHPLLLTKIDVRFDVRDTPPVILIESEVHTKGRTGVEMEALIAAQVAAATIYDMCKAVQRDIVIRDVHLVLKDGGKSGLFVAPQKDIFSEKATSSQASSQCILDKNTIHNDVKIAIITLSDKGFAGQREDTSGASIAELLISVFQNAHIERFLLPDEPVLLSQKVSELAQCVDLIVTTGGTGLSPRDTTPEAILPLLTRRLNGIEQAMIQAGLSHTPRAVLSRCLAGCVGKALILALPGSRKAALENLEAVSSILPHALEKLNGDMSDCGRA